MTIKLNRDEKYSIKAYKAARSFHGGNIKMKINWYVKILLSFVCISIWFIAGNAAPLGATDNDPLGFKKLKESSSQAVEYKPQSGAANEKTSSPGTEVAQTQPGRSPQTGGEAEQQRPSPPRPRGEAQQQKQSQMPREVVEQQRQSQRAEIEKSTQSPAPEEEELERYVTIDFENVDINLFIKYISELTGANFIIDKSVRGNVTIVSPTKISVDEAYKVFESVLEVQGFTTVPAGSVIKIVPSADARSKSVETGFSGDTGEVTDKIVTQLIPLKYADPEELKKLFTPLVSKNSVVIAYPATSLLIVTDVLSNINRLLQIIREIDVEENVSEITVIPIEHATASEVAQTLDTIFEGSTARRTTTTRTTRRRATPSQPDDTGPALGEVKIISDERTNSLIVIASAYDTNKVKSLVAILDKEIPRGTGNINVYYLQHASAEELTTVLTALPEKTDTGPEAGKAPTISKEVQIVADKATNSLVITATKADYAVLENVIKKLDIPRRMVYLEALIMEVNADKDFAVGVEWVGGVTYGDDQGIIFGGSRGGDTSVLPSIDDPLGPRLPKGFSMGVVGEFIEINGVTFPSVQAILNAYKQDNDVHIISTPQILTTDNEEAEIRVGRNVPYITSLNRTSGNQDYTNYEYKDVGTVLKITPQINQENILRLNVYVEDKRLQNETVALVTNTPTTFLRTAQTTVIIQDNNTLVIGGIIGDDVQDSIYKIPILGDIPGLGWLFKTQSQTVSRVNLYIFLTPRIIRNPAEALAITKKKRDHAIYHHETGWADDSFRYRENTREVLKSRHAPDLMTEEPENEVEHEEEHRELKTIE
jgi:general secretion pathway protein D